VLPAETVAGKILGTQQAKQPMFAIHPRAVHLLALVTLSAVLAGGCSIRRAAINTVGDALAGGGTTFSADDDPELVKAAVPFGLKLMESLLAESPRHKGLLLATASGFTQYGYAFVQQDADEIEETSLEQATALRARARRLYLRARDYGLRGLEAAHPGFEERLRVQPREAVRAARKSDVPLLYWTAAAWGSAISLSKDDPAMVADQPVIEALIDRALQLDEAWGEGAIHSFLITYETIRQGGEGDPAARARQHFERAVKLSRGEHAAPFLALAEAVSIPKQDVKEFDDLIARALAINPDARREARLANLVAQRRARWLQSQREKLFLVTGQ
jgi:predicted anti-sigma-YlaC factor YlaD